MRTAKVFITVNYKQQVPLMDPLSTYDVAIIDRDVKPFCTEHY